MLNFMIVLVAFGFLPVQEEEKRVAGWAPISKGDTFELNWSFARNQSGTSGGRSQLLRDVRVVKAKLVADQDIQGKGKLRIQITRATWRYTSPEYDINLSFNGSKVTKKVKARSDSGKTKGELKAAELERHLKRSYTFPVQNSPSIVGFAWSQGWIVNSLFDWMILPGALKKDGPAVGDTWEVNLSGKESAATYMPKDMYLKKMKMKAKKASGGIRASGAVSWSFKDPKGMGGPLSGKHSVKREWSFSGDGYYSGGSRQISGSRRVNAKEEFWKSNSSYSLKEKLTIKKKK